MKGYIVCGVALFVTAPFAGFADEKAKVIEKQVHQHSVLMSLSMPKDCIAGSALNVHVTVRNKRKDDIQWYCTGDYSGYKLRLQDSKGQPVPLTQFGKVVLGDRRNMGSGVVYRLVPGDQTAVSLNVARTFDLTQPGAYTLSISLRLPTAKEDVDLKIENIVFKVIEEP